MDGGVGGKYGHRDSSADPDTLDPTPSRWTGRAGRLFLATAVLLIAGPLITHTYAWAWGIPLAAATAAMLVGAMVDSRKAGHPRHPRTTNRPKGPKGAPRHYQR